MKWFFIDGKEYRSAYRIRGFKTRPAEDIAWKIESTLVGTQRFQKDPLVDYLEMHRNAALEIQDGRPRRAFIASAERRVRSWGTAILLEIAGEDESIRIVINKNWVTILSLSGELDGSKVDAVSQEVGRLLKCCPIKCI